MCNICLYLTTFSSLVFLESYNRSYSRNFWIRFKISVSSGNLRRLGGPSLSPDQIFSDFSFSSTTVISKDPLLTASEGLLVSDSIFAVANGDEAIKVI